MRPVSYPPLLVLLFSLFVTGLSFGSGIPAPTGEVHVVATSHLDTQWRWTIQETISEFLPATLQDNFVLFEKYPNYVFSFEGAFRYMLMKEYYPEEYERLRHYIAEDRWRVAGSWLDAVDVNLPSPESLIRHVLYGNGFFRQEFGKTSRDVYLPDCFGFGFALPSVAAHCGLLGFSTQKLTWGSAYGIPFDIGLWEGVDGSTLTAALNPGAYVSDLEADLSSDSTLVATVQRQGEASGLFAAFKYFGTGDSGGAPRDASVAWLEKSLAGAGPLRVRSVAPDDLARELAHPDRAAVRARLPRHRGELLMTKHGAGCYTSQAAMKRWNRQNEILADAAERASVLASWLGAADYPRETLREAWVRFLWHQFHDDLTGTSIPEAYTFSWNDELLSLNQFATVLTDAVGGVSRALDTRVEGVPLVVFNPLAGEREDLVEATVLFPEESADHVRVFGPDGREVPSQSWAGPDEDSMDVVFLAKVPSVGLAVFDIRPAGSPCRLATGLTVDLRNATLENQRYLVTVSEGGIANIFDKRHGRELLANPVELQLLDNEPENWAAWEVDYEDLMAPPRTVVGAKTVNGAGAEVKGGTGSETSPSGGNAADLVTAAVWYEEGPARAALSFTRRCEGSVFRQKISLAAGTAGDRVEIELDVDWRTAGTLLKAAFPLAVRNDTATYDLGLGTIGRGTNTKQLYEVPAQRWADLTEPDGSYGVAILNDCRYGWDKPDNHTLRLTLIHTPVVNDNWRWIADQKSQDLGQHRVRLALCGHDGDWRGAVSWQADRLNQPLLAFQVLQHDGKLGKAFSFLSVQPATPRQVAVRAVKLAEESDEVVIRLQELTGRPGSEMSLAFARPVVGVRELNGAEESLPAEAKASRAIAAAATQTSPPVLEDGTIQVAFGPYQPRTLAVRLAEAPVRLAPPRAVPLVLPFNLDGISRDDDRTDGDFDGHGLTLAGERLPARLVREGIPLVTGPQESGRLNVLACRGQSIELPPGDHDALYLLAAAVGGGQKAAFTIDDQVYHRWVPDFDLPVGQWDNRLSGGQLYHDPAAITPGYINHQPVGWVGTHRHGPAGENQPYVFTHFYKLHLPLAAKARILQLPEKPAVRILAITAAANPNDGASPAQPLYDRVASTSVEILALRRVFVDSVQVELRSPNPDPLIFFTRDGSEPSLLSAVYTCPITLHETTTVKAMADSPALTESQVATAKFTQVEPRAAAASGTLATSATAPGLACRYFEGAWDRLPDFDPLEPSRTEITENVGVPDFAAAEDIGLVLEGYLAAPRRGLFRLHLWSDDGSALYLGDERVIENDGLHGRAEVSSDLPLAAGLHPIRIEFFQHLGGVALELWWEGPGVDLEPVPPEALFHLR